MNIENFNHEYLTREEVAALKVFGSKATVDRRAKDGSLTRIKIGTRTFFKRSEIEEYLKKFS